MTTNLKPIASQLMTDAAEIEHTSAAPGDLPGMYELPEDQWLSVSGGLRSGDAFSERTGGHTCCWSCYQKR